MSEYGKQPKRDSIEQVRLYNRKTNLTYLLERKNDGHRGLKHHEVHVVINGVMIEFVLPTNYVESK